MWAVSVQLSPLGFLSSLTSRKSQKGGEEACFESFGAGYAQDVVLGTEGTGNRILWIVVPVLPMLAV